jgi:hypothetical protein
MQLQEALKNARREMDTQSAKMRNLEEMLKKEREAREKAETAAFNLENEKNALMNSPKPNRNGTELEDTFNPPSESLPAPETEGPTE